MVVPQYWLHQFSLFLKNCSFIHFHHKRPQLTEQADTLSNAIHSAVAVRLSDLFVAVSHARQLIQLQSLTATFQESMMNLHGNLYGPDVGHLHSLIDKVVLQGNIFQEHNLCIASLVYGWIFFLFICNMISYHEVREFWTSQLNWISLFLDLK